MDLYREEIFCHRIGEKCTFVYSVTYTDPNISNSEVINFKKSSDFFSMPDGVKSCVLTCLDFEVKTKSRQIKKNVVH